MANARVVNAAARNRLEMSRWVFTLGIGSIPNAKFRGSKVTRPMFFLRKNLTCLSASAGKRLHLVEQPRARVGPVTFRRAHGDAHRLRGLVEREADEEAELDDFRLASVVR